VIVGQPGPGRPTITSPLPATLPDNATSRPYRTYATCEQSRQAMQNAGYGRPVGWVK